MKSLFKIALCFSVMFSAYAQDDLLAELDSTMTNDYTTPAFKGLQIVTLQSTKTPAAKEAYFVVSHRFGSVKGGISEFFGLDMATTKIGGIYGLTDWLSVSGSRHTLLKVYEAAVKYRLANQGNNFPLTVIGYNTVDINTFLEKEDYPNIEFTDRLTYITQLLVSRKISNMLSLEIVPMYIHKNLYNPDIENNDQVAMGAGGRFKLGKRLSINMEYVYNFDKPGYYQNPLSVGLDIETGGHVFQLLFSNSQAMTESGYVTTAAGDWGKGDFFFGFNLYRVF